ncbi:MAG TPA: DUF1800 domain-containing protein [Pyrinomonadaceae bacterium]|jgi:uncharacterized protein (DUF1800 family)|nr:DUF1800 domain-containing protein [Pyrinomonadaceae bacterium]
MKISPSCRTAKSFLRLLCVALLAGIFGSAGSTHAANPNKAPVLISDSASTRAIALESVSLKGEPFPLTSSVKFSSDTRTRVCIFAMGLELFAGEGANALSADVQDAAGKLYGLKIEYAGPVSGYPGITMLIVRLADDLGDAGDVLLRLNLHGVSSNRVRIAIGHAGGGPANDPGSVPTPVFGDPTIPDPVATPNPYTNPSFASGTDGIRFLEQATWGPSDSDLAHVRSIGYAAWLTEQFNTPAQFAATQSDYPAIPLYPINQPVPCDATCVRDNYTSYPLQKQFFMNALTQPDQLRQRVAFALHKLLVVGARDLNNQETSWYAPYLQTIDRNAFGSFRTLLFDVTLNPGMGEYLNMRGNSVNGGNPNENYSREIMQLFSIGVDTLNQDGTPVLDSAGNRVPSYDQATITNLARVFTGWDLGPNKTTNINGVDTSVTNYLDPMILNNNTNRYDVNQKTLFGVNFPACVNCNTAQKQAYKTGELNTAIDLLFNHPNTAPYVCSQLIHQLVTSNPSPAYVGRCSAAFANNGAGVRGDMKAVITAILLDVEARGDLKNDPTYGHLREPILLMTNLLRTFNAASDGVLASTPNNYAFSLGQELFNPPTVFSYFPADFGLPGTNLFGPEFGILDTSTTYQRANFVNSLFLANNGNGIPIALPNRPGGTQTNYSSFQALAGNPQQLVDALEARMTHGMMSAAARSNIAAAVTAITSADAPGRTRAAIYLMATSTQYQVER